LRREFQGEVRFAVSDLLREFAGWPRLDITDIGESLRAQQLLGDILRGDADAGDLHNAHGGSFEGSLCARHSRDVQEAGSAGQCNAVDERASGLCRRHWKPPSPLAITPSARV